MPYSNQKFKNNRNRSEDNAIGGTNTPHPVQMLIYNDQKECFELNSKKLHTIFNSPDVRDANIAVVSIAGAFRTGKSFMLSFFLRYLNETYIHNNEEDWLGNEDTELSGFSWRNGSEPHTNGIWIWSQIFTKILPNGRKIGVMLMDTQGTFDRHSTMKDNVTIFSLSTMLSSIQIYNLFNNIREHDLQHLQLFTEYGKISREQTNKKAFQMMLFLIRDWNYEYEAPFGFAGGRKMLDNTFHLAVNQRRDVTDVRTHIKSCYEKLDCFLMPSPGEAATGLGNFAGQLKDINPKFKDMLKEFVPAILAPENVWTKKISGAKVKGKSFLTYVCKYLDILNKDDLPTPQNILGALSEANNLAAVLEATEFYQREMNSATDKDTAYLEFAQLVKVHDVIVTKSLELFRSKALMGDERQKTIHYNQLKDSLQIYFILYLGQNEMKKSSDLSKVIDNLTHEITNYQSTNCEQMAMMETLKTQIMEYRELHNIENKHRETQINETNELYEIEKKQREAQIEQYKAMLDDSKKCDVDYEKLISLIHELEALNISEKQAFKKKMESIIAQERTCNKQSENISYFDLAIKVLSVGKLVWDGFNRIFR